MSSTTSIGVNSVWSMKRYALAVGAFAFVAGVLATSGCALQGAPEQPRAEKIAQGDPHYLIDTARLASYRAETDPERRKYLRNEIIDERLLEIDHQFDVFNLGLWRSQTGSSVAVDWTLLALSGATAVIGGVGTKAALGAASTGLGGARASFDKDVLYQKSLAAVMAQMVAERKKIRADIEVSKLLPASDYTLFAALGDLQRLVAAGSIPGTLQVIAEDAGAKSQKAEDTIKSVQTAKFLQDDAGNRLRRFWKPDGKTIDRANETKLKQWMVAHGIQAAPGSVTMFLRSADLATLRVRAAADLLDR